ncbi:hypothetical protein pb186bvf_006625 [Paramecium bursaria]
MPKKQKKPIIEPKQEIKQAGGKKNKQNGAHDHDHDCNHDHDHDDHGHEHNQLQVQQQKNKKLPKLLDNKQSLMDSLNTLPQLQEMLSQLQGFGQCSVKPDDPLPDFTQFDTTKEMMANYGQELEQTLELVRKRDFKNLKRPVQEQKPQVKLTPQQQQSKDKNNAISKSNIEYLTTLLTELKTLHADVNIKIIQGIISSYQR